MKIKITLSALLFLLACGFHFLNAQPTPALQITGTVVDENSGAPIEFATVVIGDAQTNLPITGTTTSPDGTFEMLTRETNIYIEVSFIGFTTRTLRDFEISGGKLDLGTIRLAEESHALDEVTVRAERSNVEFKLDKRVFNVGQDLSSTGASALEVLNNVPSVTVGIEGDIKLRGSSGVQILINGKPSVLANEQGNALGTITADMIDRIEVITNPSAKYDAEGTSGIINIVIKKEEKKGVNGSVTLNTGHPNNHSVGLSLNRRTEKFNLFTQMGIGHRTFPGTSETLNRDLTTHTEISSIGTEEKNETFYNLILGTDYHINPYNIVSLTGSFAYEKEKEYSNADFETRGETGVLTSAWNRDETTTAVNPKYQYELQYKKDFKDHEDHDLLFSALGHFFGKDQSSEFYNDARTGALALAEQQTRTDFKDATYTFKLDYTRPLSELFTVEAGAQYVLNEVANDFEVSELIDGEWLINSNMTNIFEFDQKVLGAYGTGAYEGDKWGVKAGLRLENTDLNTFLINTDRSNKQNYTNLFPSFHASYKLTERMSFQAGYSRRIFRPRMWDLNPFFNIRNNFSIRTGNPDLLPEFTDSYEITGIYILNKVSMNMGVYHRYTTDVVEQVTTFENNVSTSVPLNIGTNRATGIEFNAKYTPAKWLTLNGDFNYNYFNRQGTFEARSFDFDAGQWSSRLMAKLKLPAEIDMEIAGNYRSGFQTFQGEVSGNLFADLGVRKKIMKGKTILNLSVRDIFFSRFRESETNQAGFYLYNYHQRGGRYVTFGISYGFGKGEAMEFSGQKRHF
jgi:outer membrane receptor protein involved in Fe transport